LSRAPASRRRSLNGKEENVTPLNIVSGRWVSSVVALPAFRPSHQQGSALRRPERMPAESALRPIRARHGPPCPGRGRERLACECRPGSDSERPRGQAPGGAHQHGRFGTSVGQSGKASRRRKGLKDGSIDLASVMPAFAKQLSKTIRGLGVRNLETLAHKMYGISRMSSCEK
jgi:hypothetical protein